jgi:hypothetical protein
MKRAFRTALVSGSRLSNCLVDPRVESDEQTVRRLQVLQRASSFDRIAAIAVQLRDQSFLSTDGADKRESSAVRSGHGRSRGRLSFLAATIRSYACSACRT